MLSCVICEFLNSGSDYWLSLWTDAEQLHNNKTDTSNVTLVKTTDDNLYTIHDVKDDSDWLQELDTYTGIYTFTGLVIGLFIFTSISSIHFFYMCTKSSINLHNRMFGAVIRAPLSFFDRTPVGKNQSPRNLI